MNENPNYKKESRCEVTLNDGSVWNFNLPDNYDVSCVIDGDIILLRLKEKDEEPKSRFKFETVSTNGKD